MKVGDGQGFAENVRYSRKHPPKSTGPGSGAGRAKFTRNAEEIFKEYWKLNYLIGEAVEARKMSKEAMLRRSMKAKAPRHGLELPEHQ